MKFVTLCLPFIFICCGPKENIRYLYISPNGSIENSGQVSEKPLESIPEAIDIIFRESRQNENVTFNVMLQEGTYSLDETVRLTSGALNGGNVNFKGVDNEKVIISGGERIIGQWDRVEERLWKIPIQGNFKQLFKNDERLVRARYPNVGGYFHPIKIDAKGKWMVLPDSASIKFKVNKNMEMVTTGKWHFIRQKIKSINSKEKRITTETEIGPECSSTKVDLFDRVFFENHLDFLDVEKEWFLDDETNTLYLYSNTDPNESEFYYPKIESLFVFEGNRQTPINVSFESITFKHTTWSYVDNERKGIQAGAWGTKLGSPVYLPSAAVILRFAENCHFKDCTFQNLGEGAIAMEEGCHTNKIENNSFDDVGSNVIQIARISDFIGRDHPLHFDYQDSTIAPSNNSVKNNHFINGASIDRGAVAILVGYANHTQIKNNFIENFPYTGISIGWRWGNDGKLTNTNNNDISFNRIQDCMKYLSDGGAIYTVGNQPGTKIHNNWISKIGGGEQLIEGIYTDEGSGNMLIENNYLNDIQNYDYKAHKNLWNTMIIRNNGCESCTNELLTENEFVRYANFPDGRPVDPSKYGLLK